MFAKWSACMRAFGYDYATPFAAGADKRWAATAAASPIEIQTAERDISCKLQTNLLGVEYAVQSAYEEVAIAHDAQSLDAVRDQVGREAAALPGLMKQYAGG